MTETKSDTATDRVKRETISVESLAVWSSWTHALSPEKAKKWYTRDEKALSLSVLPTRCGGVYEIAIGPTAKVEQLTVVYAGRATKVRKDKGTRGVTLRERIYSRYCVSGAHISSTLRSALSVGLHVFFRWTILSTVKECVDLEKRLLTTYDYAWDSSTYCVRGVSAPVRIVPIIARAENEPLRTEYLIRALFRQLPAERKRLVLHELSNSMQGLS